MVAFTVLTIIMTWKTQFYNFHMPTRRTQKVALYTYGLKRFYKTPTYTIIIPLQSYSRLKQLIKPKLSLLDILDNVSVIPTNLSIVYCLYNPWLTLSFSVLHQVGLHCNLQLAQSTILLLHNVL